MKEIVAALLVGLAGLGTVAVGPCNCAVNESGHVVCEGNVPTGD